MSLTKRGGDGGHIQTPTHPAKHACMHKHTPTHTHTHTHAHIHKYTHTHTCAQTPTHMHAHTHTHTQTCMRTYTHTHTHTHTHTRAHTHTTYYIGPTSNRMTSIVCYQCFQGFIHVVVALINPLITKSKWGFGNINKPWSHYITYHGIH